MQGIGHLVSAGTFGAPVGLRSGIRRSGFLLFSFELRLPQHRFSLRLGFGVRDLLAF